MTNKEKELIASTPITVDCFEMDDFYILDDYIEKNKLEIIKFEVSE